MFDESEVFIQLKREPALAVATVAQALGVEFEEVRFTTGPYGVEWTADIDGLVALWESDVGGWEGFDTEPYDYLLSVEYGTNTLARARAIFERLKVLNVPMMLSHNLGDVIDTFAPAA